MNQKVEAQSTALIPMSTPRRFEMSPSNVRVSAVLTAAIKRIFELVVSLIVALLGAVIFSAVISSWAGGVFEIAISSAAVIISVICGLVVPFNTGRDFLSDLRGLGSDGRKLSRMERALLAKGELIYGVIEGISLDRGTVEVGYLEADGERLTQTLMPYRQGLLDGLETGAAIPLIIDPDDPRECAAPTLLGVDFERLSGDLDVRPAHVDAPPLREPDNGEKLLPILYRSLRAISLPWWVALSRRARGLSRLNNVRFYGMVEDRVLTMNALDGSGAVPNRIVLDEPFRVVLSVWPLEEGRAELSVSLHQGSEVIAWRGELAQSRLARRIPVQQTQMLWMLNDHFEKIWPVVRFYAALHGEDPGLTVAL